VSGADSGRNFCEEDGLYLSKGNALASRTETRLANLPSCLIGMEACVGAHHLSCRLKMLGHDLSRRLLRDEQLRGTDRHNR